MTPVSLASLQDAVRDENGFAQLAEYPTFCQKFLMYIQETTPTRILSPKTPNYIFYQYGKDFNHKITRPLNSDLFIESPDAFVDAYGRLISFLGDLSKFQDKAADQRVVQTYMRTNEVNKVVYTIQQAVGCVGDSFPIANQARKRVGQAFEKLVKYLMRDIGVTCEGRTIKLPVPNFPGYEMSYELDIVFSRDKAIITEQTPYIHPLEIVGSVKTTSKDRLDKVFLDKYLLTKLLGRDIPVVAIFLHDVQRASTPRSRKSATGATDFGIASTFKKGHFLGYTVALTRLDGVYYVDPRPEMLTNDKLREQIRDFQQFLVRDLWSLSHMTDGATDLELLATSSDVGEDTEFIEDAEDEPYDDEQGDGDA